MARTVAEIQAQIIATKEAQPELAIYQSDSKRAIWRLWTFVMAVAIAIFEQLMDLYVATIEALVAKSPGASTLWVQDKMFKFQYSATDPQIVQLVDLVPVYPVVDANKRIITACSVTTDVTNTVSVKVAKGNPYQALSAPEKTAAQAYIDTIGVAGINYVVKSQAADKIMIDADIYFQGQYSAVIQQAVIDTLNAYLQQLSIVNFNGSIKMSDLEGVIRNVTGVVDVVLNNVRVREDGVIYANGTDLIVNTSVIQRLYNSVAGYLIQETTPTHTFADTLNFIAS